VRTLRNQAPPGPQCATKIRGSKKKTEIGGVSKTKWIANGAPRCRKSLAANAQVIGSRKPVRSRGKERAPTRRTGREHLGCFVKGGSNFCVTSLVMKNRKT